MQTPIAVSPFRKKIFGLWLIAPLLQACFLIFLAAPADNIAWYIQGTFFCITTISSAFLFTDTRPFSLYQIWWLFYIIFMGVVPAVHYDMGVMPWRNGDVSNATHLRANALIIVALLLFAGIYHYVFRRIKIHSPGLSGTNSAAQPAPTSFNLIQPNPLRDNPSNSHAARLASACRRYALPIILICGVGVVAIQGAPGLFLRGHADEVLQRYDSTFLLLFDKVIRGAMLTVSITAILLYRECLLDGKFLVLLLLTCILFNFPLSIPRYLVAAIYLGWAVAAGGLIERYPHLLKSSLLFGLLVFAPLANVSRYSARAPAHVPMNSLRDYYRLSFITADMDPYASLCRTIMYVDRHGNTKGMQALGVTAFFVPRRLWPQKPVGSGYTVYEAQGFEFKNVSCTLLAEGLINGGWPGAFGITAFLGILLGVYDKRFGPGAPRAFYYAAIFYPVAIGMLLFVLRGDLLSSFAYTAGLAVSGWLVYRLLWWLGTRREAASE